MRKGRSVFSAVPQAKTYFGKSAGKCLTSNHLHSETLWLIPQFVERSRELLGRCIRNYSTAPCYTALLPAALQLQEFSNGDCVKANKKKKVCLNMCGWVQVWTAALHAVPSSSNSKNDSCRWQLGFWPVQQLQGATVGQWHVSYSWQFFTEENAFPRSFLWTLLKSTHPQKSRLPSHGMQPAQQFFKHTALIPRIRKG